MTNIKEELTDLFNRWKAAHDNDEHINTCPLDAVKDIPDFIKSFIPDGCVDYDEYSNPNTKRVLFILKEPGSLRKDGTFIGLGDVSEMMKSHWYKTVVTQTGVHPENKYYKKFCRMLEVLGIDCKSSAMMNINKRGGYSRGTNIAILNEYYSVYKEFINEQIRILDPDIIVSCTGRSLMADKLFSGGEWCCISSENKKVWLRKNKIVNANKEVMIYEMYHPAYTHFANSEKYRKLFEDLVKGNYLETQRIENV